MSSNKMLCVLCLTPSDQTIHIFEKEGMKLNICSIITQHFSLQPSAENANDKVICFSCWQELNSFHKFYQKVEEAHSKLISTWSAAAFEPKDILSAAIQSAGIIQDSDDEPDYMETLSSEDEDGCEEFEYQNDYKLKVRRMHSTELDQVIRQHMKLTCNICHEVMQSFYLLKRHFESVHHQLGYVICCKLKFKERNSLAVHIFLDHNLVYMCDKCGQYMVDRRALNIHKAVHTNCASQLNMTSNQVTVHIEKTIQTSTVTSCTTNHN